MAKKPKLLADGKDYVQGQGFVDASLEINLPGKPTTVGPVRGVGTPITKTAFQEMQNRYFANKQPNDTQYVTFGREAILSILAQYDCAGIKFYFAQRMDTNTNQLTLCMVGVDEANHDLSTPSTVAGATSTQDSLMTDVGSGYPPTA
jgi:hypothetical protein